MPAYNYPNDPTEIERLDDQYEILKLVMDGRNYMAPFSQENPPKRVLDVATGTGIWAVEMGDEFPEAKIIGTDLSPIQPQYVPLNVRFFIEDSYVFQFLPFLVSQTRIFERLTHPCLSGQNGELGLP